MPRPNKPTFTRRDFVRWSAAGAVASATTIGYADVSTNLVQVEEFELTLPNWDVDGFRAVVLSDLHMNNQRELRTALLAANLAKDQKGDVIFVPGDFVEFSDKERLRNVRIFSRILADGSTPVFATMGNHDYGTNHPEKIIQAIERSPIRLLRNEIVDLDGVSIAGIDDAIARKQRPDVIEEGKHARSLLAMFHEPDYVREMPKHVSLQVSGHSHGGQICLPFGIPIHTPFGARRYIDGYYPNAPVPLFVTRGIGTTGPTYRLFCRPQVAVLTLRCA